MQILNTIKNIVSIAFFIIVPILLYYNFKQKEDKERIINNFTIQHEEWVTSTLNYAKRVNSLVYTIRELKAVQASDSIQYSQAQKELVKAKAKINELNLKLKTVDSYINNDIEVKDTIITKIEFKDTCSITKIEPISTLHLDMEFYTMYDTIDSDNWPLAVNSDLLITYKYNATVSTVIDRQPAIFNDKGKKRFILWRWINPKYKYYGTSVIDDPNAKIKNNIVIKFKK